ncbi:MAG TPA: hypothetical protein VMF10_11105 [Candidatus Aquilonibacter sp.]|nr:hypothetical protein [Candidatus Aquilonibacter sp.]
MKLSRLTGALIAYLALGVLAVTTLSDQRVRAVTLLILGLFAFKTWVRRKDVLHPDGENETEPAADEAGPAVEGELEMRVAAK